MAAEKIEMLYNFVDLQRFAPLSPPQREPQRLLVLSNHLKKGRGLDAIEAACDLAGLQCRVIGDACGQAVEDTREALAWADAVIAQGRSALEAMASGRAVILAGVDRLGPLVTRENVAALRPLNFGFTCLTEAMSPGGLLARLRCVEPLATAEVCAWVRAHADMDEVIDRLLVLYAEAREAALAAPPSAETVLAFASAALAEATPAAKLGRTVQALHRRRADEEGEPAPASIHATATWVARQNAEARKLATRLAENRAKPAQPSALREQPELRPVTLGSRVRHAFSGLLSL